MKQESTLLELQEEPKADSSHSSQLTELIPMENEPFTIVRVDTKYFLALGKYKLSDLVDEIKELEQLIKEKPFWLIMSVMQIMIEDNQHKNK